MEDALVVVDAAMEGEMNCRNATPNATRITRSAARCMRCEDMGTKRTAPVRPCPGCCFTQHLGATLSCRTRGLRCARTHYATTWYPNYGRSCAPKRGIGSSWCEHMVWQQPVTVKPLPRTVTVYTCARKRSSFEKATSYLVRVLSTWWNRHEEEGVASAVGASPSSPKDAHRCHPGNRTWRQKISSISSVASPGEDYPFSPQQGAMMAAWRALRFQEYRLSLLPCAVPRTSP